MLPGQFLRPYGQNKGPPGQNMGPPGQYIGPSGQEASYNAFTNQVVVSSANYQGIRFESFNGIITLACIAILLCDFIFGPTALILALRGKTKLRSGDYLGAIRLRNASIALSVTSITKMIFVVAPLMVMASKGSLYIYKSYTYWN